jgi:hypothetical protein
LISKPDNKGKPPTVRRTSDVSSTSKRDKHLLLVVDSVDITEDHSLSLDHIDVANIEDSCRL